MTAITICLPLPPKALSPNGRTHWAAKAKAVAKYRGDAALAARAALDGKNPPKWELATAKIGVYKRTAHAIDADNLIASLKAGFDGIADAGIVANDRGLVPLPPTQHKVASDWRVEIVIEPR